jgi:hypothetical protein
MPSRGDLLRILAGEHLAQNPQAIRFWDPRRARKQKNGLFTDEAGQPHLVDSSGHPFIVIWDADGDGTILNPAFGFRDEPARVEASVLVFSAGPDGDYGTWKDNMTSWINPP